MMRKIETVSLIGLGAIGAAYGSRLHAALGDSFRVVADEERIKRYKKDGILVNGEIQTFHYTTPDTISESTDLVLFAVKNAELPQAIKDVKNSIGPNTIILSLLNGISSEDEIYSAFQNEHILHSISVEIDAVRQGNETTFSTLGRIEFGGKDISMNEDVLAVKELFDRSGIQYKIPENILHTMWWKFMINVGINQTSAILRAPYGVFQSTPSAYRLVEDAMREVVALSQRTGVNLSEQDVKSFWPILHNLSPNGKTSMLQDIEAGRKTEVEFLGGVVCEKGDQYGVLVPVNKQLVRLIEVMEDIGNVKRG
ncbi:ketopantoate reductase family protein [Sporosarcina sp.]|uniref:ketopantoate reductase family protein n=1 Tax=Sporosarcina sp. TaxID=49982 RepID=UPI00260DB245|nr:ketopantoate reductase family protein [Sporosarcina sp.]